MNNSSKGIFLDHLKDYQKREHRHSLAIYYQRLAASFTELQADSEVISEALLSEDKTLPKNEYLYLYQDGEIKLRSDSRVLIFPFHNSSYEKTTVVQGAKLKLIDPVNKKIIIHCPNKPPQKICLMPSSPINADVISEAVEIYLNAPHEFNCVSEILNRQPSNIQQKVELTLQYEDLKVNQIIRQSVNLSRSHITIQGPPGTGKTYVGARIILELILQGRRVGVMALSHKAINNLLLAVDELISYYQVKNVFLIKSKSPENPANGFKNIVIGDIATNFVQANLIAGTVYSLSRLPGNILDTLVIDEAGQIPLAWIMASGKSAKNIVMLGDHKQLPQVSQSAHPQGSGESVMEHLMGNNSVIPEKFGHFLSVTRRMNAEISSFISNLMYDGKLQAHPCTANYVLQFDHFTHPALNSQGLYWLEMNHENCSQESRQEASEISKIIQDLQRQNFPLQEVMVITPYRAQEALLKMSLPATMSESIGTVDKFQGREADIVIFSMTTSDGANLPRDVEFLFSTNRLNVAISRARKKAIIIVNKKLLTTAAKSLEQLQMINKFCLLKNLCNGKIAK